MDRRVAQSAERKWEGTKSSVKGAKVKDGPLLFCESVVGWAGAPFETRKKRKRKKRRGLVAASAAHRRAQAWSVGCPALSLLTVRI